MRAVRYDSFGGIDGLRVEEVPDPEAAPGRAVVRVQASCINPGSLSAPHGSPYVPLRDLAGTVVSVGADASSLAVGDEVLGWAQDWSAHAELVAVPADQLVAKPAGLSWDVAGSLYVTPMAGLAAVRAVAPRSGELVMISGASGGVGLTAAQLARRAGADVIGIASPANAGRLQDHGIVPVAYGQDLPESIRGAAGGRGIDAFIDTFGSGYVELALSLGVPAGRINTVVDHQAAQQHGVTARGTRDAGGAPALAELAALAAAGDLAVPIAATYPLGEVRAAHHELTERRPFGRVVLHPAS